VRRSSIRAQEETAQHAFLSPYRCHDCRERFWVVSRNTYYLAVIIGVALAVGALVGNMQMPSPKRVSVPQQEAQHAEQVTDLSKLAEKGDPAAEYELAKIYMDDSSVPKNEIDARKWLERAAVHGNTAAQYELGLALRDGRGGLQDFAAAMKWINVAAEGGYGKAQLALGLMYRQGLGTHVDDVKAYTWFNLAAAQGVDGAAAARDVVRTRLSPDEINLAQSESRRLSGLQPGAPDKGSGAGAR
jgi:uncharacterized protein